ncbi:PD-(D/E)XK nuclease family protein [Aureibaculum sp. 2210JD6-5]|uniref:PD-(D/E)XK nuclease family protein n=1 Tax=Aureibaculum sp. 2210JD6-5 TaxID=3103957 RepID=UPI002AAEAFA6|nr:PD-(D/E)XK nuclease family protein [Aureibaculum sp. 2210JD6-5]MDY7394781.1 PD-(D/E)XK nuclease family protein [Aureibaculum sp. 2210JD6-5]
MQSFLNDVVKDIFTKNENISELTFVLPSKRAGTFLKNSIKEQLSGTLILPKIISIEEFIEKLSNISAIDNTSILFEFYTIYKRLTPENTLESFENFTKWAPLLLQDFNEIDRNLIDTKHLFSYLTDIKRLETLLKGEEITDLISKQVQFYANFENYYNELYAHLLDNKIGYQGMQYREAEANIQWYVNNTSDKIVLVGFNALNTAEENIFKNLLDNDLATIYWDIDTYFEQHNPQVATFIHKYKTEWNYFNTNPFNWTSDNFSDKKNIKIIGTPKDISQIKYAGELLKDLAAEADNLTDTALVLAEESLLSASLNSLPKEVENVNITMGYELKNIPLGNVFDYLFKLQAHHKNGAFYYKELLALLNHPQIKSFFNDPVVIDSLLNSIAKNNFTYLGKSSLLKLSGNDSEFVQLSFLFDNWENKADTAIKNCIRFIELSKENANLEKLEKEYLFRFYTIFQKLSNLNQKFGHITDIKTLNMFYNQMLKTEKLSFQGEPLSGLQIMGVLETRVLDFKNIIITSVNEGILPAGKSDNSFIPFDVKREVGLPTYKEKDAIFAYHFFRLLQRAENVYALYNTEADSYGSGELSRFLTQLEIFKKNEVEKFVVSPETVKTTNEFKVIPKNEFVHKELKDLAEKGFSASTLTNYILNPLEFYNQKILKIKEIDEVEETIAMNTLGTIIHKTLEAFYEPYVGKNLSVEAITEMKANVASEVQKWFKEVYRNGNISTGKNLLVYNVAQQFVRNFLNQELEQIKQGNKIKILALEQKLNLKIEIEGIDFPIQLVGEADRIDELNGITRIIDYKTGKVTQTDLNIKDWSLLTKDYKKHNKAFQVLFYALLFSESIGQNLEKKPLESGIISFKNLKAGFLKINKGLVTQESIELFKVELKQLFLEIFDINIPILEKESPFTA